jgi:capsular polysaccharide export protein
MYSIQVTSVTHINHFFPVSASDQMLFPNDIEGVLLETHFTLDMLALAGEFRQKVIMKGLTRFSRESTAWRRPVKAERVILVVGQVESDPSLKHGSQSIRTNLGLLQAVCRANADAYIVYKPHPAVLADMQLGSNAYQEAYQWFDEIVGDATLCQLLPKINEVHVMSSLAGFEALLRGKKVSCYGHSFYAGWGLTHDRVPMPNRPRQLSVDELVAGAMYCFPRYMSRLAGKVTTADEKSAFIHRPWRSGLAQAAAGA